MASKTPTPLTFLLFSISIAFLLILTKADSTPFGNISVYWGQGGYDHSEGSLQEACDSGNYHIIIFQQLLVYDNGSQPSLNLVGHCNDYTNLEDQIKYCQQKDIKILLQIGQVVPKQNGPVTISKDAPKKLANFGFWFYYF